MMKKMGDGKGAICFLSLSPVPNIWLWRLNFYSFKKAVNLILPPILEDLAEQWTFNLIKIILSTASSPYWELFWVFC